MNILNNFKLLSISVLLAASLAACDKTPGPAESAGKAIDQAASDTGKKIETVVEKVGEKMADQSAKGGVVMDDTEITSKVKAAVFAEPGLKTLQISVDTVKGVVTLSGSVDTQPNSDQAKALASAVSGVTEVKNDLMVKPN